MMAILKPETITLKNWLHQSITINDSLIISSIDSKTDVSKRYGCIQNHLLIIFGRGCFLYLHKTACAYSKQEMPILLCHYRKVLASTNPCSPLGRSSLPCQNRHWPERRSSHRTESLSWHGERSDCMYAVAVVEHNVLFLEALLEKWKIEYIRDELIYIWNWKHNLVKIRQTSISNFEGWSWQSPNSFFLLPQAVEREPRW